jgi:hypothetical protein
MRSARLRRALRILLLLASLLCAAAGCRDAPEECERSCRNQYEACLADGPGPLACDAAYDDCLDRCTGLGAAGGHGPDGG